MTSVRLALAAVALAGCTTPAGPAPTVLVPRPAPASARPPPPEQAPPKLTGEPLFDQRSTAHDGYSAPLVAFAPDGALIWVHPDGDHTHVTKIAVSGAVSWDRPLSSELRPAHIAIRPDGGLVLAGNELYPDGHGLRFVMRLGTDGAPLWEQKLEVLGVVDDLAIAGDERIFVTGHFRGSVDFGGGPLKAVLHTGDFVLALDDHGDHLWSQAFYPGILSIAASADGGVLMAGNYPANSQVDHGAGPVAGPGVLAKLDPGGAALWARHFDHGLRQVLLDADREIVAVPFPGFGAALDAALIHLDPEGHPRARAPLGSHSPPISFDASGHILALAFVYQTAVTLGGRAIPSDDGEYQLVKLTADGELVWHRGIHCNGQATAAVSADGHAAVTCIAAIDHGPYHRYTLAVFSP